MFAAARPSDFCPSSQEADVDELVVARQSTRASPRSHDGEAVRARKSSSIGSACGASTRDRHEYPFFEDEDELRPAAATATSTARDTSPSRGEDDEPGPLVGPQWSVGSSQHAAGLCKPCAWHWKPGGCANGSECRHCHKCPDGEILRRKRSKAREHGREAYRCIAACRPARKAECAPQVRTPAVPLVPPGVLAAKAYGMPSLAPWGGPPPLMTAAWSLPARFHGDLPAPPLPPLRPPPGLECIPGLAFASHPPAASAYAGRLSPLAVNAADNEWMVHTTTSPPGLELELGSESCPQDAALKRSTPRGASSHIACDGDSRAVRLLPPVAA